MEERYVPDAKMQERSFLSRAFERHFNERPFFNHSCYLFVTLTTPERMRQTSAYSTLCRSFLVPQRMRDGESVARFLDAAGQMERILNDSGIVKLERLPCRAAHRYGGGRGPRGPLLRTLRHAAGRQRRPPARCRTDAHRRQTTHALYALRSGCDAADHGHRRSLRTALDGALRLPPLVRGSRGTSAAVQPHLQPDDLSGQPRPDPRTAGSDGTQHELPVALLALQCAQQGVDRPLPQ